MTQSTREMGTTITPPEMEIPPNGQVVDAELRFPAERRADGDRYATPAEKVRTVFHAVDRGVRVPVVELRQHDVGGDGDGVFD